MRLSYSTLDVFTEDRFGGNPLAVFPDAEPLERQGEAGAALMQRIASELNLSETVFVLPPQTPQGTRRVRIFTPASELPFAGHPTLGTAFLLTTLGFGTPDADAGTTLIVLEEGVGPLPVTVRTRPTPFAQLTAAQPPELRPAPLPREELAALLGLGEHDLDTALEAQAVSCGLPFLIVPLRDHAALAAARVDLARWGRRLAGTWAPQLYLISANGPDSKTDFRARCFVPGLSVPEDPATGSAAAALAGYLALHSGAASGPLCWRVEQGIEMHRPSVLHLEADLADGAVTAIRVGGGCVLVAEASMRIA
jgi:trans-2,3-dihydro-3-hydroxyanthranilate isomerase